MARERSPSGSEGSRAEREPGRPLGRPRRADTPCCPERNRTAKLRNYTFKIFSEKFWAAIKSYDGFVTFNGRGFDCPFLMVRSAVQRVKPTRDLLPNRYSGPHIDLMDQLTFFGAWRRRFPLDMWCKTFGIRSPKADGITGYDINALFRAGKCLEIARYCAGDLRATRDLLAIWEEYMKFPPGKS